MNTRHAVWRSMFVGVLLYSVVLGFFNDYTDIIHTKSYSWTFGLAVVMQVLTYLTFALKDLVVRRNAGRAGKSGKLRMVVGVWLVMFTSKFVFLAVISVVFGGEVQVSGFIGLLVVIAVLTIVTKLAELIDGKLADPDRPTVNAAQ